MSAGNNAVPWVAPTDVNKSLVIGTGLTTKLQYAGSTNVCFVDAFVRIMKATTPALVRRAFLSVSGNDNITTEW